MCSGVIRSNVPKWAARVQLEPTPLGLVRPMDWLVHSLGSRRSSNSCQLANLVSLSFSLSFSGATLSGSATESKSVSQSFRELFSEPNSRTNALDTNRQTPEDVTRDAHSSSVSHFLVNSHFCLFLLSLSLWSCLGERERHRSS